MKIPLLSKIPRSTLQTAPPILLLALALVVFWQGDPSPRAERPSTTLPTRSPASAPAPATAAVVLPTAAETMANAAALTEWVQQRELAPQRDSNGLALAERRGEIMRDLIPRDPEMALAAMLPLEVYRALPPEMRALIESPFATVGSLAVVPDCSSGRSAPDYLGHWDGESRRVFVPRARQEVMSKDWISLSGIELDGMAALHADPVWVLPQEEIEAAADLFALARPARPGPTALVAGRFVVADEQELLALAEELRRAEEAINPAARPIMADGGDGNGDEPAALLRTLNKVDTSWSLTDKRVLFLNLKFSDSSATAITKSALETRLADCDTRTDEMSYGAVSFSATVASTDLTLPNPKSFYDDTNDIQYGLIYDQALALAVTEGLITNVSQSIWSSEYDIIGVVFPYHSGAGWSGRASVAGRKHWINGAPSFGTYIHEFGHNYGLLHASRWVESTPSEIPPTPPTANNLSTDSSVEPRHSEYGDWFDYMGGDGEFGVMGKNRLSWIGDGKVADLTGNTMQDQTIRLYRFDEPTASGQATLGVRVQMQDSETFWLSYRGNHAQSVARQGAHVAWQISSTQSRLLDMTPESGTYLENILPVGRTYTDPSGLVTITPLAKGGAGGEEWLDVRVVTGVVGNTNPTVTLAVDQTSASPLDVLSFTATGDDDDGDPLIYNWNFGDGRTESGAGSSLTHAYQVGGTYAVTVSALDGRGGYAEETLQVVIADPLLQLAGVPSGTSSTIYDVVSVNGRFLAVASYDLLTSFDGLTWSESPTPNPVGPHYGIHASASGMTLVGQEYLDGAWRAQIWESADGIAWETIDTPVGTGTLRSICEGSGVLVAVGDDGTIMRKLPGAAWQNITSGESRDFNKISHDGSRFWAIGDDGLILASTDGASWSPPVTAPDGQSWSNFDTGLGIGGTFYAGGEYGRMGVTTNAGDDWIETLDSFVDVDGLAELPSRIVCFGHNDNLADVLFVTTNGDSWSQAAVPSPFQVYDSVFGAGRLVAVGSGGVIQASGPFFPNNQAPTGGLTLPATVQARQDFNLSGSITDPDGDPLTYYWNLGEAWIEGTATPTFNFAIGGSRTIDLAVVDAKGGVLQQSFAVTVEDPLTSFTQVSVAGSDNFSDVVCAGEQVFAISFGELHTGPVGGALVQTSSINPMYPNDLATDGTTLVLVGQTYDSGTAAWVGGISSAPVTSPVPLTKEPIPVDSRHLNGVTHGNGTWVAVGDGGRLLSKSGAGAWTERTSGVGVDLNEVAYGGGVFMAVGASGTVLVSGDGITWSPVPGPTGSSLSDVDYCGNGFCVGGSDDSIHYTDDAGVTWHTTSFLNFGYRSAIWTGDVIVVVGRLYDFGEGRWVPHLFVSADGIDWQYVPYELFDNIQSLALCGETLVAVGSSGTLLYTELPSSTPDADVTATLVASDLPTSVRIAINSQPGEVFDIYRTQSLSIGFGPIPYDNDIPAAGTGTTTEWTDSTPLPGHAYYRVKRK